MLVNKTVEFFLSEVARRGWDWARCRRVPRLGWQRARSEMPTGRNRVAAGRDGSEQMLGRGRRRGGAEAGQAAGSERHACRG